MYCIRGFAVVCYINLVLMLTLTPYRAGTIIGELVHLSLTVVSYVVTHMLV